MLLIIFDGTLCFFNKQVTNIICHYLVKKRVLFYKCFGGAYTGCMQSLVDSKQPL